MPDTPDDVAAISDPLRRARASNELIGEHQSAVTTLAEVRVTAMLELIDAGITQAELARLLHLSRARIGQLLATSRPTWDEREQTTRQGYLDAVAQFHDAVAACAAAGHAPTVPDGPGVTWVREDISRFDTLAATAAQLTVAYRRWERVWHEPR